MAHKSNIHSYKDYAACRTAFYALILMVFMIGSVRAQEFEENAIVPPHGDIYTIDNIKVDVTADNAVEAREKAFEAAQIKGFEALAKRVLDDAAEEAFETPDLDTISSYVEDYEVSDEKLSSVRYQGVYKIRYSENAFARYAASPLNGSIGGVTQAQAGHVLVLPYLKAGNSTNSRTFLWQVNPFLEAWSEAKLQNRAGNAIIPVGDSDDIKQIRGELGLNYDPSRLNAMRLKYGADEVKIMIAHPVMNNRDPANATLLADVEIYNALAYGPQLEKAVQFRSYPGESQSAFYNRMVRELVPYTGQTPQPALPMVSENNLNQNNSLVPNNTQQLASQYLTAQIYFTSMQEWINLKNSLERIQGVERLQVKSLTPAMAVIDISYTGQLENLRYNLRQNAMMLYNPAEPNGQIYQIKRAQIERRY